MTNNKKLLPFVASGICDLITQIEQEFTLSPGGAEMVIIEVIISALLEADASATSTYLALLSSEMPQGDDFDIVLMARARQRILDAVAENI